MKDSGKVNCDICGYSVDLNKCRHNSYSAICEQCLRSMSAYNHSYNTGLLDSIKTGYVKINPSSP